MKPGLSGMAMKKKVNEMQNQIGDQTLKGSVLAILTYLGWKIDLDPEFMALCLPVLSALFAWASTRIGDPHLASIFDPETKEAGVLSSIKQKVSKK